MAPMLLLSLVLSLAAAGPGASPEPHRDERNAEAFYLKALECFEQNTLDYRRQGLRHLEEAVRLAPENMTYRLALAHAQFVGGYYRAARQGFERVAAVDSADAYLSLGLLWRRDWLESQDPASLDRAVDALVTAAWLDPRRADAWLLLVPLYLVQHKPVEAASAAFSALETEPERLEAHLAVASTLCHIGVVGVGDSIFRATIPRLPPGLVARFERVAPLPPDRVRGAGGWPEGRSGRAGGGFRGLGAEDEDRLWAWSRLTERFVLLPAPEKGSAELPADLEARFGSPEESERGPVGRRVEWGGADSATGETHGPVWQYPELGIRMQILDRLLAFRPDLSDSRVGDAAAPSRSAIAAMYARVLAALGGAQEEGGHGAAGPRAGVRE